MSATKSAEVPVKNVVLVGRKRDGWGYHRFQHHQRALAAGLLPDEWPQLTTELASDGSLVIHAHWPEAWGVEAIEPYRVPAGYWHYQEDSSLEALRRGGLSEPARTEEEWKEHLRERQAWAEAEAAGREEKLVLEVAQSLPGGLSGPVDEEGRPQIPIHHPEGLEVLTLGVKPAQE